MAIVLVNADVDWSAAVKLLLIVGRIDGRN